jgi:pyridoxal biosynthesis lyase PdxS
LNNANAVFQACAVMALERVPADIRREGGVARMTDPKVNNKPSVEKTNSF